MKYTSIVVAIVVGLAFIIGSSIVGQKFLKSRRAPQEIVVTGAAERMVVSDLIVWTASVEVLTPDLQSGYRAIKEQTQTVTKFLNDKGIDKESYALESISIDKEYDSQFNANQQRWVQTFVGYKLRQYIKVTSQDVDRVEQAARDISSLLAEGIELTSQDPLYYYSKLNETKHEMLTEASQDALNRAKAIAEGSGANVGELRRAQMGVFQVVGLHSNDDYSWGGSFNTSSKNKTATITVRANYAIR